MHRVSVGTKVAFGFGEVATATNGYALSVYLFFYYNQVLGLDAGLASLALGMAIVFDGINDPIIGSISDNWHSRLGRRHPLMWFSVVPLCISFYFLFQPAPDLHGWMLFLWLLAFSVLTRSFMTFFQIPHTAFGAELSTDYAERSRIMSFQTLFGWIGGVAFSVTCYTLIFARTENLPRGGLLNAAHYFELAALGVLLIFAGIVISTAFTQREGRRLARVSPGASFGLLRLIREILNALANRNFRIMFMGIFIHGALGGIGGVMALHMQTYFWGLVPSQIWYFSFSGLFANFAAFGLIQLVIDRFEKRNVLIGMALFGMLDSLIVISLRLLGWFPENGDPILLPIIVTTWTLGAVAGAVAGIMARSMIADVVDESELATGLRQEGMFFSALAFSGKAVSGIGVVVGGFVLSLIQFPTNVDKITSVPAEVTFRMGVFMGPILACLYAIPIVIYCFYNLDRGTLRQIQLELESRKGAAAPLPAADGPR